MTTQVWVISKKTTPELNIFSIELNETTKMF